MEAVGQNMEEEAADELLGGEGHHLALAGVAVVGPAAHLAVFEGEQPAVGDRYAVGVAGEIGQDLLRVGEGGFGIDDPCDRTSPGKENGNVT